MPTATDFLNQTLGNAHDKASSLIVRAHGGAPTTNPFELTGSGSSMFTGQRSDISTAQEQYKHNRGRVAAAISVLTKRIAAQPLFVASDGTKKAKADTVHSRYLKGQRINLPVFMKRSDPERLAIIDSHPLADAIDNPNRLMTRAILWDVTVTNLLVTGRAFWMMSEIDGQKQITPFPTTWVKPDNTRGIYADWLVRPPWSMDEPIKVPAEFMAHFYFPDPSNPLNAQSPLELQGDAILADEAISTAQRVGFKNGVHPATALIVGEAATGDGKRQIKLTMEQRQELMSWFQQQWAGVQRHGAPIILDSLIKDVKPLSTKPLEMAFRESAELTESQIYMGFGVNPIVAGKVQDVNRASSALADQHLVNNSVNPIIEMVSQAITKWVVPFFSAGEKLKAWIEPCEPHDPQLQLKRYEIGLKFGAVTQNEYRRDILNLPPTVEGDVAPLPVSQQLFPRTESKNRLNGNGATHR